MIEKREISIVWFRRDLRLNDNKALYHAIQAGNPILCVFIFDDNILSKLPNKSDRRLDFINQQLVKINAKLIQFDSSLKVLFGDPEEKIKELLTQYMVKNVFCNSDYEPYSIQRDSRVNKICQEYGCGFHQSKDQVIFEKNEIVKSDNTPYHVFTAYKNKWRSVLNESDIQNNLYILSKDTFLAQNPTPIPSLENFSFKTLSIQFSKPAIDEDKIKAYDCNRDFPSVDIGSHLGIHLRFGTISIRSLISNNISSSEQWINQLIWREFYMMLLWHYPSLIHTPRNKKFESIQWNNDSLLFENWCSGNTGYPMVDAGMRELNQTGYMHNRVRMICASFLCKHLLIDWKLGEQYFANTLDDFELASNNGNWQWVVGCGFDAAPYFRVFNPTLQAKRLDPKRTYIKKWVPELGTEHYPDPIIDHTFARHRCIKVFSESLKRA